MPESAAFSVKPGVSASVKASEPFALPPNAPKAIGSSVTASSVTCAVPASASSTSVPRTARSVSSESLRFIGTASGVDGRLGLASDGIPAAEKSLANDTSRRTSSDAPRIVSSPVGPAGSSIRPVTLMGVSSAVKSARRMSSRRPETAIWMLPRSVRPPLTISTSSREISSIDTISTGAPLDAAGAAALSVAANDGKGSSTRAPTSVTEPCSMRRESRARKAVPTSRRLAVIRAGSPIRTSFNVMVTRGKIVAPMLPTRTGWPSAAVSCDSTAARTVSLARWRGPRNRARRRTGQQRGRRQRRAFHGVWLSALAICHNHASTCAAFTSEPDSVPDHRRRTESDSLKLQPFHVPPSNCPYSLGNRDHRHE